ncbi:MAG: TlpA family protein disulfide reductase [Limisphaerales bacterium]
MKKLLFLIFSFGSFSAFAQTNLDQDLEQSTLIKVGAAAPAVHFKTIDGKDFDLKDARGKIVLIDFFATWCGPCIAEMPHLQNEIWSKFKDKNFVMVAIDREESEQVVKDFQSKRQFGFSIACDPKREIYSKFATKYIPRNFLIDANGQIVFQSVGYTESDFNNLVTAVEKETVKSR